MDQRGKTQELVKKNPTGGHGCLCCVCCKERKGFKQYKNGSKGTKPRTGKKKRNPGSVRVGLVVDKVALGQVFLRVLRFCPVNYSKPKLYFI